MQSFVDAAGRTWHLDLTMQTVMRLHREHGLDVARLMATSDKGGISDQLASAAGVAFVGDVLWAIVSPQCESVGVSREQFLAAISGDVYLQALQALLLAVVDFFVPPRSRSEVRQALATLV